MAAIHKVKGMLNSTRPLPLQDLRQVRGLAEVFVQQFYGVVHALMVTRNVLGGVLSCYGVTMFLQRPYY